MQYTEMIEQMLSYIQNNPKQREYDNAFFNYFYHCSSNMIRGLQIDGKPYPENTTGTTTMNDDNNINDNPYVKALYTQDLRGFMFKMIEYYYDNC
jgi:hypothetical protein